MPNQRFTELVPAILNGDDSALSQLVVQSLPALCGVAQRSGASWEDAQEVALDVIYATFKALPRLDLSGTKARDPLFSYMAKAAKRGAAERYRKQQQELAALGRAANVASTQPLVTVQDWDEGRSIWAHDSNDEQDTPNVPAISRLVDEFDDTDRMVFHYRTQTNLTSSEIAEELSMSPAGIRKRWQRIVKRFERNVSSEVVERA
jgi:RNA polymerase sigma factor (sigma-70 family)